MDPIAAPNRNSLTAALALGTPIMLGLVVGGFLLGREVRDFKRADRYVEVKGLVERTVRSDSATWPIVFSVAGDSLPDVFAISEKNKATVLGFLSSQGFSGTDVTVGTVSVTDRSTVQYGANEKAPRFIVQQAITVQSSDVDKVARANAHSADLIRAGVVIQSTSPGQPAGVLYKFNGLNALKPDMITEATHNARNSAYRFAADSGSSVGAIRSANQGVFSISAAQAASPTGDDTGATYGPDQQADASIMKKVRVVSTIDYYLVN